MIPAPTLLSLACLIASNGQLDTSSSDVQLINQIEVLASSDTCLPENIENLLKNTNAGDEAWDSLASVPHPTDTCF